MRRPTLPLLAVALSTACGPQIETTQLEPLNRELAATTLADALSRKTHFAPLCDDHGYPLVGNIVSKSDPAATASNFCAALRNGSPR
jgi:hypothetical protein